MFEKLKYFSTIFFGTFIIAVGVYFFMNPNHIISGSISGLAVVLVNFVPLSLSAMTLLLNIICIILAFLFVDKTSCCRRFSLCSRSCSQIRVLPQEISPWTWWE